MGPVEAEMAAVLARDRHRPLPDVFAVAEQQAPPVAEEHDLVDRGVGAPPSTPWRWVEQIDLSRLRLVRLRGCGARPTAVAVCAGFRGRG